MTSNEPITIVSVDKVSEGILVHFSDDSSVLYHAPFLYDVRHDDGNVAVVFTED